MEGSPAQHAGIVAGEIILRLDDAIIYRMEDLLREIHKRRIGEKVMIAIFCGGREQFFEITLSKMP